MCYSGSHVWSQTLATHTPPFPYLLALPTLKNSVTFLQAIWGLLDNYGGNKTRVTWQRLVSPPMDMGAWTAASFRHPPNITACWNPLHSLWVPLEQIALRGIKPNQWKDKSDLCKLCKTWEMVSKGVPSCKHPASPGTDRSCCVASGLLPPITPAPGQSLNWKQHIIRVCCYPLSQGYHCCDETP